MNITTIEDVKKYMNDIFISIKLWGTEFESEFKQRFKSYCGNLGDAIADEFGVSKRQAKNLPDDTRLGKKANKKFKELKEWVSDNR